MFIFKKIMKLETRKDRRWQVSWTETQNLLLKKLTNVANLQELGAKIPSITTYKHSSVVESQPKQEPFLAIISA